MKIINEASTGYIEKWKTSYNEANNEQEKLAVIEEALSTVIDDKDVVDRIMSFGYGFLNKWINAMKWEELGYEGAGTNYRFGNEFIILLNSPNLNEEALKNTTNFSRAYNIYANNLIDPEILEENTGRGDVYRKLLSDRRAYQFSEGDVISMINIFLDLYQKGASDSVIKRIFLEDKEGSTYGDLNELPVVKERLKYSYNKNHREDSQVKTTNTNKMSDDQIKELANSFTDNQIKVLGDALRDRINNQ